MRFEYSDDGSNKFWDIERAGSTLTIKFGKIGAAGQTQLKTFGSDAEAIKAHDKLVAEKIGHVLSGGMRAPGTKLVAQDLLDLEREAFVSLCGEEKTRARIEHTLKTGKPLRN